MRNIKAQTPFYLVSTLVLHESDQNNVERADRVAAQLTAADVPFKRLALKIKGYKEGDAPVFLLDAQDINYVHRIARENFQSHFISVNAFSVGTRIEISNNRQDAVIGNIQALPKSLLAADQAYLETTDGAVYIWS